jgi:hypothetical protein
MMHGCDVGHSLKVASASKSMDLPVFPIDQRYSQSSILTTLTVAIVFQLDPAKI